MNKRTIRIMAGLLAAVFVSNALAVPLSTSQADVEVELTAPVTAPIVGTGPSWLKAVCVTCGGLALYVAPSVVGLVIAVYLAPLPAIGCAAACVLGYT